MAIGKEIKVVLTLDDKGFKVGIRDASGALQNFEKQATQAATSVKNVENHFASFGAKAHQLVTTMGMARFALMDLKDIFLSLPLAVLKTSGEVERLSKLMEGLSTETDTTKKRLEALNNTKFLFNMAQNAPFEVKALGDAFVKLKTGGIDPTNGSLKALVEGVAKFGGTSEQLKRAAIAIQQMGGKGVVSMEELRQQLGEAVPTAMQAMADGMNMSMAQLTKAVSQGTVSASMAMNKMLVVMGIQNAGAAKEMMSTWVGMLEQLKTKWELFKLAIGEEGMFDSAKAAVQDLMKAFGTDTAGSMARSIGRALNDAVVNVVAFTKEVIRLWDTIKMVGEAMLIYWGASKVAPILAGSIETMNKWRTAMLAGRDATLVSLADEASAKRAAAMQNARFLQERIDANQAEIAAEQQKAAALRAVRVQELREQIAANEAVMAVQRQRIADAAAAETARATSKAVALGNVAGLGTPEMRAEAAALSEKARQTKVAADQAEAYMRKLELQNGMLREEANLLAKSKAGLTDVALARQLENSHLQLSIDKYKQKAAAITEANRAMAMMQSATTTVISFIKSMVFSMNGLVLAITAAAYAWDYFSSKAKKAAEDAKNALNLSQTVERGKATREGIESAQRGIDNDKARVEGIDKEIKFLDPNSTNKQVQERIAKLRAERVTLVAQIEREQKAMRDALTQVARKDADAYASDLKGQAEDAADAAIKPFQEQRAKLVESFKQITKPTEAQQTAFNQSLQDLDVKALEAKRASLQKQATVYRQLVDAGKVTADQKAAYEKLIESLNKDATGVGEQIITRKAANVMMPGTKKGPENEPTDALLNKMNADENAVRRLGDRQEKMNADLIDISLLRQQATDEINMIMNQDRRLYEVHDPGDVQKAIDQLTQRKVLEEAVREQQAIFPKLEANRERLRQLQQTLADPGHVQAPKGEEEKLLVMLERIRHLAGDTGKALDPIIRDQRELLQTGGQIDIAQGLIEADKRVRQLRVDGVLDTRVRIMEEGRKEVADAEQKYKLLIEKAMQYDGDIEAITQRRTEEMRLLAEKQARALETPLQKLAREWNNGYEQILDATKSWAQGFLDTLTDMLTTGRGDWRKFLAGMLTDILQMNLKKEFGGAITGMFSGLGASLGNLLGIGKPGQMGPNDGPQLPGAVTNVAATAAGDAATQAAQKAAAESAKALADTTAQASGAMVEVSSTGLAQMGAATVTQALTTTTAAATDEVAMAATALMTDSTVTASLALMELAAAAATAAAGESAGSFFANGGVMSSSGSLPLKKYANGGIANKPQLAVFGEGSMNEAYVPLPDGRSIPVTMRSEGGAGGAQQGGADQTMVMINIEVNEADGSSSKTESGDTKVWSDVAEKVKAVVQQEIAKQSRPGGILYK